MTHIRFHMVFRSESKIIARELKLLDAKEAIDSFFGLLSSVLYFSQPFWANGGKVYRWHSDKSDRLEF